MHNQPVTTGAHALSQAQLRALRCLAGMMIPANSGFNVPGADDDTIFVDILNSMGRDAGHVLAVVQALESLSGGDFTDLERARREDIATQLRNEGGQALMYLTRIILQCYYRDDRVMRSLEMEVRPPFPKGFEVEQGDWSLLDPVRARPPFYRLIPPQPG